MPQLGEIRKASKVGRNSCSKAIWQACIDCGKERWVRLCHLKPSVVRCRSCGGRKGGSIKKRGGRRLTPDGYIEILIDKDDFYRAMAQKSGYVGEHRLVMAKKLGRCLQPFESVHHRNSDRSDNRIQNLLLVIKGAHNGEIRCPFCLKKFGVK